jgi:CheY-like chemotaxis protein
MAGRLLIFKNTADQPFLIFSDINMPEIGGIELRKKLLKTRK